MKALNQTRQISSMKLFFISILGVGVAFATALFFSAKMSDSYSLAVETIGRSEQIIRSIGAVEYSVLLGTRHNLQPKNVSCGSLTFFVKGSDSAEIVEIRLRKEYFHKTWDVYDIVEGMETRSQKSCTTGTALFFGTGCPSSSAGSPSACFVSFGSPDLLCFGPVISALQVGHIALPPFANLLS